MLGLKALADDRLDDGQLVPAPLAVPVREGVAFLDEGFGCRAVHCVHPFLEGIAFGLLGVKGVGGVDFNPAEGCR